MLALHKLSIALDRIAVTIGKAASWLILPLIMIIMVDVVTRKIEFIKVWSADITVEYGFSISFIAQDLQWHIHGVLLLLTFGYAYLYNAHVRVDIFRELGGRRRQAWIEIVGLTFAMIFLYFMVKFSWDFTYASWRQGEGSESMVGIGNRFFIKSFLIWGFIVLWIACAAMMLRSIVFLFGDEVLSRDAENLIPYFTDKTVLPKLKMNPDGSVEAENLEKFDGGH
ncbi:MAG: TRAP transporter small permease subunit [Pseudomonadota bacterium]